MAYKAALSPLMSEMGRWKQFKKDTKAAESILLQAVCISAAVAPGGHCNATAQPAAHTHTHTPSHFHHFRGHHIDLCSFPAELLNL